MVRVIRPDGILALATHGPDHYYGANDAFFRIVPRRYVLGDRLEVWPRQETKMRQMLANAALVDVRTRRLIWQNNFGAGGEAYDFFAATSALWWSAKFDPETAAEISRCIIRNYFEGKPVTQITHDVIFAYGRKL